MGSLIRQHRTRMYIRGTSAEQGMLKVSAYGEFRWLHPWNGLEFFFTKTDFLVELLLR